LKRIDSVLPQVVVEPRREEAAGHLKPRSAWKLFRQVIATEIASRRFEKAFLLACHSVLAPVATWRWFDYLESVRVRAGVETVPYRLARKAGQTFLHHSLPPRARIHLLTTHYEQLLATLGATTVAKILRGEVVVLAQIEGRSAVPYRLYLARNGLMSREGELIIHLERLQDDRRVATMSVVVGALAAGEPTDLWIGGLQGCRGADSKAVTVKVTRDLWGLRPKDLMIHVAYALADVFGAARVKAISNAGHAFEPMKGKRVGWRADYDSFWRELGGEPIAGGFFLLPEARHRRSAEEVQPSKRSAWRGRYALLDEIGADIRLLGLARR